jgi:2-O-A-mannosyl-D-glycerate-specific PTS system IIC component
LGAIAGGLIAGYLMRWVKNHIRLNNRYNGFLTYYLYPVLGVLGAGSLMLFVIGEPVAWLNNSLTAWLNGLSGTNALLLGTLLGFMCSFDLGGPVNKAAYAFCLGAMANGVYGPYAIFASVKMVSAFTVTASTMLARTSSNSLKSKPVNQRGFSGWRVSQKGRSQWRLKILSGLLVRLCLDRWQRAQ